MDQFKICMLGEYHAGKTSLVDRFVHDRFVESRKSSLGVRIDKKQLEGPSGDLELVIWDMVGANKYQQVQTTYLRHASAYVLVIDGTRSETAAAAIEVHERAQQVSGALPYVLVVNKCDHNQFTLDLNGATNTLADNAIAVVSTSAKSGTGVEQAFEQLARTLQEQLACAE
jgi:small GTP-binding protein